MMPKQEKVRVFSNSTNEKAFTINASPEAFRILSSGLYSNKPQAIVRELSCNAWDSHRMAGYPERPFKIHLPDAWEPFFSVEDFGIGLDDDDINNIYTSYFTSTKTGSNDTIGGLGLGSKTPFSYTDTFTIRSRKDSVERIYNAYISEAGSPTVSLMTEVDTDLPNGVLVTVPIKQNDFYTFQREARNVFEYFEVLPEINIVTLENNVVQKLAKTGIIVNHGGNTGVITAVMGNVAYRVQVTETIIPKTYEKVWNFLARSSMVLRYDIGELSVAASRETISFDAETKQAFIDRIESVAISYYKQYQDHIDSEFDNVIDALDYVNEELGDWAWNILTFKGEMLETYKKNDIHRDIWDIIDPEDSGKEVYILYRASRGYTKKIKKTIFSDCDEIEYRSILTDVAMFSFIMDDTEHHRGVDAACRSLLRDDMEFRFVISIPRLLTDDEQDAIREVLGGRLDDFHTLTDIKARFKVVREKAAVLKGPRKTPVERVKKNEIRVQAWINNEETKATHLYEAYTRKIDIDEISSKRVGIVTVCRGYFDDLILGTNYITLRVPNYIVISKVFELDYIIMVKPSQYEKTLAKMPFAIEIKDLKWSDVRDNDFGFAATFVKGASHTLAEFNKKLDSSVSTTWLNGLIFNESQTYKENRSSALGKLSNNINKLNIPDFSVEDNSKPLRDKLEYMYSKMTEAEIKSCSSHCDTFTFTNANPWYKIREHFCNEVGTKVFAQMEEVTKKYPLLETMTDIIQRAREELEFEDDEEVKTVGVIDHINEYIRLVHQEATFTDSLYIEAA